MQPEMSKGQKWATRKSNKKITAIHVEKVENKTTIVKQEKAEAKCKSKRKNCNEKTLVTCHGDTWLASTNVA